MSKIVDAVTAVVISGGDMLMVRRQPFLKAFPGYHAFPGGKIDLADSDGDALPAFCDGCEARLLRGLLREIREELSVDLTQMPAIVTRIRPIGIALTPPNQALRFNTHFFIIELAEKPAISVDLHEIHSAEWAPPGEWLARYRDGRLLTAPPTLAVIEALAVDITVDAVAGLDFSKRFEFELPLIEVPYGVRNILVRSHTLPPAAHTNCFLLGDSQSHRILVDPSPASDEEMDKLCRLVDRFGIHEVFLTHHHPDHHERAPDIARKLGVPIGMSEDTQQRLLAKKGLDYFRDLAVHHYREGDVICRWLGRAVHVVEVPGHDEGHLALMPEDRA
ncbi:MAG TPA: MBL fold metallo-hydrolase, partial [Solimonas sp.]|nr:MBL fold metallo-hydrolase [Solimonas sp.]